MSQEPLTTAEIRHSEALGSLIQQLLATENLDQQRTRIVEVANWLDISFLDCAAALLLLMKKNGSLILGTYNPLFSIDVTTLANLPLSEGISVVTPDFAANTGQEFGATARLVKRVDYVVQPIKMARYRLEVGKRHQLTVKELKKVLIEESGVDKNNINNVMIHPDYTLLELPDEMPQDIFQHLKTVEINQQQLNIKRLKVKNKKHRHRGLKKTLGQKNRGQS